MKSVSAGLLVVVSLLYPVQGRSDTYIPTTAMNASTIAQVFIDDTEIRTELEIGLKDIRVFADVLPVAARRQLGLPDVSLHARLNRFLKTGWVIRSDAGPLPGRIVSVTPSPRLVRDKVTGAYLGYAIVAFRDEEEAQSVLPAMHGLVISPQVCCASLDDYICTR